MPTNTDIQKRAMLDALEKSLGIVTTAVKAVGIARSTHYDWMEADPDYKASVEAISEMAIDFAESQLHKRMKDGSDTAIIFYLKTKAKKRGYVERQEIQHEGNHEAPVIFMMDERFASKD
jgi:hypothetical protein